MSGISFSFNVSTRSKIGLYCLISAALRSDFQDIMSCGAVSSPFSSVQWIMQLLLVSKQIYFFGGSYDADMNSELLFSPNKMYNKSEFNSEVIPCSTETSQTLADLEFEANWQSQAAFSYENLTDLQKIFSK